MVLQTLHVPLSRKASYRNLQYARDEFAKGLEAISTSNDLELEETDSGCEHLKVRCSYENVAFEWNDTRSNSTLNSLLDIQFEDTSNPKESRRYFYHKEV